MSYVIKIVIFVSTFSLLIQSINGIPLSNGINIKKRSIDEDNDLLDYEQSNDNTDEDNMFGPNDEEPEQNNWTVPENNESENFIDDTNDKTFRKKKFVNPTDKEPKNAEKHQPGPFNHEIRKTDKPEQINYEDQDEFVDLNPGINDHRQVVLEKVKLKKSGHKQLNEVTAQISKIFEPDHNYNITSGQSKKESSDKYVEVILKPKRTTRVIARYKIIIPVIIPNVRKRSSN